MALVSSYALAIHFDSYSHSHFDSNQSNPHAAKSLEVEKELDERSLPLDEYQRMMIEQGKYLTSSKEAMESALAQHLSRYERLMDQAIMELLWDEGVTDKIATVEALLDGRETLAQRYLRVQLYMEVGRFAEAISLLEDVPVSKALDTRKDEEYLDYHTCFSIWRALEEEDRESLTSYEEGELLSIVEKRSNQAIGMAQVLLYDYASDEYLEVLVEPAAPKSNRRGLVPSLSASALTLFPNPAKDIVTLSGIPASTQRIELIDASGKLVLLHQAKNQRNEIIETRSLRSGHYDIRCLDHSGHVLATEKLIIR